MLHPEVAELLAAMRDLEHFLDRNNEAGWATAIRGAVDLVEKSDAYGLKKFLDMFGGIGTLNDIVLYRDGEPLKVENDSFQILISRAFELAFRLRHEAG